jgi:hypothetical protein
MRRAGSLRACSEGWTGIDCSVTTYYEVVLEGCLGHGTCVGSACSCERGWAGEKCGLKVCLTSADGSLCGGASRGTCAADGQCECAASLTGIACEEDACPNECSGHGACDNATLSCACSPPFTGADCSLRLCPANCSSHGRCDAATGRCACASGCAGEACERPAACPTTLLPTRSGCVLRPNASADDGAAFSVECSAGWSGRDCSEPRCLPGGGDCYGKGYCRVDSLHGLRGRRLWRAGASRRVRGAGELPLPAGVARRRMQRAELPARVLWTRQVRRGRRWRRRAHLPVRLWLGRRWVRGTLPTLAVQSRLSRYSLRRRRYESTSPFRWSRDPLPSRSELAHRDVQPAEGLWPLQTSVPFQGLLPRHGTPALEPRVRAAAVTAPPCRQSTHVPKRHTFAHAAAAAAAAVAAAATAADRPPQRRRWT